MKKFWDFFNMFEGAVMVIGMIIMVFFNFFNVCCRYLLPQSPFSYTEELVVIVFIWVTMFGISYGYRKGAHTMLDIFTNMFPRPLQYVTVAFSTLCSIGFMVLFAKVGIDMVANQIAYNQVTSGLRLPMAVQGIALPIGAIVAVISITKTGYDEIKELHQAADEAKNGGMQS